MSRCHRDVLAADGEVLAKSSQQTPMTAQTAGAWEDRGGLDV